MTDDDIRDVARQAAREAVAAEPFDHSPAMAEAIRAGRMDRHMVVVRCALAGADAAYAAAAPLIRAQCAGAADPALTDAVVELREALAANRAVLEWMAVNGAKVGPMYSQAVSCLHRSRAALSRVEVSR